jgi:hypothetical protein
MFRPTQEKELPDRRGIAYMKGVFRMEGPATPTGEPQ